LDGPKAKQQQKMVLFIYYCILLSAPPKCLNKDFTTVPSYVTHQWVPIAKNGSLMPFPYNTTVNGELSKRFNDSLMPFPYNTTVNGELSKRFNDSLMPFPYNTKVNGELR
jgi:hypothetical protein